MGCSKSSFKREVYSNMILPQETKTKTNKQKKGKNRKTKNKAKKWNEEKCMHCLMFRIQRFLKLLLLLGLSVI